MKKSIGAKLLSIFGGAIACLLLISVLAYRGTVELVESSDWVLHTQQVLNTLNDTFSALKDIESAQRGYLITGQQKYLEPYEAELKVIEGKGSELKGLVKDNPIQTQRAELLTQLVQKKLRQAQKTLDLQRAEGFKAAQTEMLNDKGQIYMEDIRRSVAEMSAEEKQLLKKREEETKSRTESTKIIIVSGISAGILMFLLSGIYIIRTISIPLKEMTLLADKISLGDLSVTIPDQSREDEIGLLSRSFARMTQYFKLMAETVTEISQRNLTVKLTPTSDKDVIGNSLVKMLNSLRTITTELREGSNVLAASTSEILAVVSQVSVGTTETAAAVSETTATVEQVKQTAQVSSQKAKGVSENSRSASEISQNGKKTVEASVEGMNQIKNKMELITENIMKLSEQSQTIGEIISTVNDLAEQSNLLAVNASIEAARAGEQGRGFVIVAQEVKMLADQSKQATAQVRTILNEIQKATSAAVMAAEQGSKAVEAGMNLASDSGKSITALSERLFESAQAATLILVSSEQQVIGVSQVALAMESIKQASSKNVIGTKQVETVALNLNQVGRNMKDLVDQFRV